MNKPVLGVIGLGYIGQPTVAALANVGYDVVGMDIDPIKIKNLKQNKATLYEPGLNETLQRIQNNCRFTNDYKDLMNWCDAILITVGTPLGKNNEPDFSALDSVVKNIGKYIRHGQIIILRSTVSPGTTEKVANDLAKLTKFKCGKDFFVSFCPERTIEGLALHELYNLPKIIGGINPESTVKTAEILKRLGSKVVTTSSATVAELCKLADNMYRALNIAFANEFGDICELAKIDAYEVVNAVNSTYSRTNIFRPGLGAAGPCLSKDPTMLSSFAENLGMTTELVNACISVNKNSNLKVIQKTEDFLNLHELDTARIAILGLAFKGKPETDDYRESPAATIHQELIKRNLAQFKRNINFTFYDPIIYKFFDNIVTKTLEDCIKDANVILFLNDHPKIMDIPLEHIIEYTDKPVLIIDAWHNVVKPEDKSLLDSVEFIQIGVG